jgi:hypothetical protein
MNSRETVHIENLINGDHTSDTALDIRARRPAKPSRFRTAPSLHAFTNTSRDSDSSESLSATASTVHVRVLFFLLARLLLFRRPRTNLLVRFLVPSCSASGALSAAARPAGLLLSRGQSSLALLVTPLAMKGGVTNDARRHQPFSSSRRRRWDGSVLTQKGSCSNLGSLSDFDREGSSSSRRPSRDLRLQLSPPIPGAPLQGASPSHDDPPHA